MGCTVSGVERRNYERFVWCQEKSIETPRSNKSRQFSTCGKVLKLSPLKSSNRSNDLGKIIMLRTTDSGRKFVSKTFKESPRIKESSNSNENPRVTLFKNLNKELCAVDRTCNTSYLKGTVEFALLSELRSFIIKIYVTDKLRTALGTALPFSLEVAVGHGVTQNRRTLGVIMVI